MSDLQGTRFHHKHALFWTLYLTRGLERWGEVAAKPSKREAKGGKGRGEKEFKESFQTQTPKYMKQYNYKSDSPKIKRSSFLIKSC